MATLTTMLADVRSILDEAAARQWSDAEITRWINEALRDIARRAEILEELTTKDSVSGTADYTLDVKVLRVNRVEWVPTAGVVIPLTYMNRLTMDSIWGTTPTRAGDPFYYTMRGWAQGSTGKTITLFPVPNASVSGGIKVYGYVLPDLLSSGGDTVDIPNGWEDLPLLYAAYTAMLKDGDQRWREWHSLYEFKLGNLIEVTRSHVDVPDALVMRRVGSSDESQFPRLGRNPSIMPPSSFQSNIPPADRT